MSSARSSAFIPAVDDAWAILSQPPGERDLVLPDYWAMSSARSRRRREARRPAAAERGGVKVGVALAALAFGGIVTAGAAGPDDAVAQTSSVSLDLSRGSTGPAVVALQQKLGIAADGVFGPQTQRAVKRFQRAHGIPAIGRVGPLTTAALGLSVSSADRTSTVKQRVTGPAAVPLSPEAAKAMQAKLGVAADGVVGPQTRAALRRFEAAQGLPADGQPDAQVLQAMGVDPAAVAPEPATAAPPAGSGALAAMNVALAQVGTPYASAGAAPGGFDCSGLTQYAFRRAGISLPRTSYAQFGVGTPVSRAQIQAGDLVFFNTAGGGASHVGIATGPSTVVSATTHGVMQHAISDGYWGSHYVGARRV